MADFISQFREQTGDEYKDYTDLQIAKAFHSKYEQDTGQTVDFNKFTQEAGISLEPAPEPAKAQPDNVIDFPGDIAYQHGPNGPEPIVSRETLESTNIDKGQLAPSKIDTDQTQSGTYQHGRAIFLDDAPTVAEVNAAGNDSTWQAVKKAYDNIPEDFLMQYYGLQARAAEVPAQEMLTATEQDIQKGRQEERQRLATIPEASMAGLDPYSLVPDDEVLSKERRMQGAARQIAHVNEIYRKLAESQKTRKPIFVEPGSVAYYASSGVSSMANTAPAITAGIFLGPEVSLLMFYKQAQGKAYLDGRTAGLSPKMADDYATYTGLAEAIPEMLPVHFLTKGGTNFFKRVLQGAVAETVQEEITEMIEIGLDAGYIKPDMTWAQARQRLIDAGILATLMGPTQAALAHPLVMARDKIVNNKSLVLSRELNKEVNAADFTVDEEDAIQRLDPNQLAPDNSAQAVIFETIRDGKNLDDEVRKFEEEHAQIPGDRRHNPERALAGDRRRDQEKRKKIADMTEDELRQALLTSDVTGIPNRRAYEDSEKLPVQISVDADSLKWVNDNMSPESGDQMLRTIGQVMSEETNQAYHISGDEFMGQAQTEAEAADIMQRVNNRLKDAEITIERPDGETVIKKGLSITYGVGGTKNAADHHLKQEKVRKEQAGERAARGTEPPGVTRRRAEGQQNNQDQGATEEKIGMVVKNGRDEKYGIDVEQKKEGEDYRISTSDENQRDKVISSGLGGIYLNDLILNMDGEFVSPSQIIQGGTGVIDRENSPYKPRTPDERSKVKALVAESVFQREIGNNEKADEIEREIQDIVHGKTTEINMEETANAQPQQETSPDNAGGMPRRRVRGESGNTDERGVRLHEGGREGGGIQEEGTEQLPPPQTLTQVDTKRVAKLRKTADGMEKQIDAKLNPAVADQNPTPRRSRILEGMRAEGERMQRIQGMLRAIADQTEAGTLDKSLANVSTKAEIETLLSRDKPPQVMWRPHDTKELEDAIKGLRGIKEDRDFMKNRFDWREGYLNNEETAVLERLIKAADKAKRDVFKYSYLRDSLAAWKRAHKLNIESPKTWSKTRDALLALERPVDESQKKARTIDQMERALIGQKIPGFFPTPEPVIEKMLDEAGIQPGEAVLEPSAGNGAIMDAIRQADTGAELEGLELNGTLREILAAKDHKVLGEDFMQYEGGPYDKIVMNPPFEKNQDIQHVKHAYSLLRPGGRVVAIMSEHPFFANDKASTEFRDWLDQQDHTTEKLPDAFKKGKIRTTGVASRLVVINKPEVQSAAKAVTEPAPTAAPGVESIEYGKQSTYNRVPTIEVTVKLRNGDNARVTMEKRSTGWDLSQSYTDGKGRKHTQGLIAYGDINYTTGLSKKGAKQVIEYVSSHAIGADHTGMLQFEGDPRDLLAGVETPPNKRWVPVPKTNKAPKTGAIGWTSGAGNPWFKMWFGPKDARSQLWTNGHVLVIGKNEFLDKRINNLDEIRGPVVGDENTTAADTLIKQTADAKTDIKPIALYQASTIRNDEQDMVIFDAAMDPTEPVTVNAEYYRMFKNLYPEATFRANPSDENAPVVVLDDGKLVGLIMPMRPGGRAFEEFPIRQIRNYIKNAGARDFTRPKSGGGETASMSDAVNMWQPGNAYAGSINSQYDPNEFTTDFNRDPARREAVLQQFAKNIGIRLYQGRVKGKSRLGFYRPSIEEIRIKNLNDLETAAHEIAHYFDDKVWNGFGRRRGEKETRPWLHGAKARVYARELKSVSYDASKVYEGFAEFVRHWMTRPDIARKAAPEFYDFWESFLNTHPWGKAMRQAQADIMGWFNQRAVERAASKIGDSGIVVNDALSELSDRGRQYVFDDLEGLLAMETSITGEKAAVSGGPYETARLMRGAHAVVDGALRYGPPVIDSTGRWAFRDRAGNLDADYIVEDGKTILKSNPDYQSWGLRDVLAPVAHLLDEWSLYATGRAAQELMGQGRENLFKQDEIDAMLDMGRDRPEFAQVFDDYQKWNSAILDFAEQTGILGKDQRKKFRRTQYIPFYRVGQGSGVKKRVSVQGHIKPITVLTGGTNNLNDILGNMVKNASSLIVEGIKNDARRKIAEFAMKNKGGGMFIAPIGKDTKQVQIDKDQVIDKFMQAAFGVSLAKYKRLSEMGQGSPEIDQMLDMVQENLDDFVKMYMYGQPPKGSNLFAVMNGGKPTFYEVADPLLLRSLTSFTRTHPGVLRRFFGAIRRLGQSSVTLSIDFMTANIWRDTIMGSIMSKHGFRPFIDSLAGMRSRLTQDAAYREYLANGGGFSSYLVDPKAFEANLSKFYAQRGIDFKTVLHTPEKMLLGLEMIADAFEVATRIGEFRRGIQRGETARTAAYSAREVSTDFSMRGDSEALSVMYDTVIFLKAGMNGMDRMYRGFTKDTNRASIAVKSAALAAASVTLYLLNRGNPCYDDLEDWDKDTNWHVFVPRAGGGTDCASKYVHLRFPKVWEVGAIASSAERTMGLYLDHVEKGHADGKEYAKRLQDIFVNLFKMEYIPQGLAPLAEVYWLNKNRFSQRQIENEQMQELLPFARYTPYTNRTLVEIAKLTADMPPELQFSPAKAEALIRGYLNTWGMYGLFMSDEILMGDKLPAWRTDQYPVLRRFTRNHPLRHTQYEREFWDLVREAAMYYKTGQKMIKDDHERLAEKFLSQDPAPLYKMLTDTKNKLKAVNDGMLAIYQDPEMTPEQKRVEIDKLQLEKNQVFKEIMTDIKGE